MKKLLSILLALMLIVTVISGCGASTDTADNTTAANTAATTAAPASTVTEPPKEVEKKMIEMNLGFNAVTTIADDDLGKFLEDKFKVHFSFVNIAGNKLQLMAAAGELPDFAALPVVSNTTEFTNYIKQGMIREIPKEMIDKYSNIKYSFDNNEVAQAYFKTYGKIYGIPKTQSQTYNVKAITTGFYYRADWLKNVGIEKAPETVDEFYEMMKAFTLKDPDKNNKNDTYGTSGFLWQIHFIQWGDTYDWVKENGKWIPGYLSDKMINAIKFWNKLYKEKLMDPEFANANPKDLFKQNKIGVLNGNSDAFWLDQIINKQFAAANPDIKDPMEAVKLLAPLKLDASSKPAWPAQNYEYELFASKAVDDEKLERLIEIYDWFLGDEGKGYYNYGFESKDYKMENGKYVSLLPKDANGVATPLVNVYKSANIKSFFTWGWDEAVDPKWNATFTDEIVKLDADVKAMYNPATFPENVLAIIANVPAKESCSATMGNVESDYQTLVTSNNVEKDFAAFKTKTLESQGMQDVIEEVTKYMADKGFDK